MERRDACGETQRRVAVDTVRVWRRRGLDRTSAMTVVVVVMMMFKWFIRSQNPRHLHHLHSTGRPQ